MNKLANSIADLITEHVDCNWSCTCGYEHHDRRVGHDWFADHLAEALIARFELEHFAGVIIGCNHEDRHG